MTAAVIAMKRLISFFAALIVALNLAASCGKLDPSSTPSTDPEPQHVSRTLVVVFSATGHTRAVAEYAAEALDADLYEIEPAVPYTEDDLKYYTDCRADREQQDPTARPEIAGTVDVSGYDLIALGYPIWHGQAPRIICTFLEAHFFAGKTIAPFCTSGSSGVGSSADNLHALAPDATWLDGVRFPGSATREQVFDWAAGLKPAPAEPSEPANPTETEAAGLTLTVNGSAFAVTTADSEAARAMAEMLPMTLEMRELNGNEKYAYLSETLPTDSRAVGHIEAGDVMLYGDSCLVVFYESFDTGYSYTPIGHIDDPSGLAETLGGGDVTIEWHS